HLDREQFAQRFVSLTTRGTLAEDIESAGWPVQTFDKRPGIRPGLVPALARWFRREDIDLVHTHNRGALLYGGLAPRLARVGGVIHTRHGLDFGARRRQTWAFRAASRLANCVVCISDASVRASTDEGVDPQRLCRIWNGIDIDRFAYRGPIDDGPLVLV